MRYDMACPECSWEGEVICKLADCEQQRCSSCDTPLVIELRSAPPAIGAEGYQTAAGVIGPDGTKSYVKGHFGRTAPRKGRRWM